MFRLSACRPAEFSAAHKVKMKMLYSLTGDIAAVVDNSEAVVKAFLLCNFSRNLKDMSHNVTVALVDLGCRLDVLLRDNKNMCRCLRCDITECKNPIVLIDLVRRNFPIDYFAKKTIRNYAS